MIDQRNAVRDRLERARREPRLKVVCRPGFSIFANAYARPSFMAIPPEGRRKLRVRG